jgi:hypothetical protein
MQLRKSASGPESERSGNGQRGRQTRVTQSGPPAGVPLSGLNPFGVSRQLGSQPREDLNHNHAVATARTPTRQHTWRVRREIRLLLLVDCRRCDLEQCADHCDVFVAVGAGQEPVVTDEVEALGQHVRKRMMNPCA